MGISNVFRGISRPIGEALATAKTQIKELGVLLGRKVTSNDENTDNSRRTSVIYHESGISKVNEEISENDHAVQQGKPPEKTLNPTTVQSVISETRAQRPRLSQCISKVRSSTSISFTGKGKEMQETRKTRGVSTPPKLNNEKLNGPSTVTSVQGSNASALGGAFNLEEAQKLVGNYELDGVKEFIGKLNDEARNELHKGATDSTGNRKEFLKAFHAKLQDKLKPIPNVSQGNGQKKPIATLTDIFGNDPHLFELYQAAVKEEKNSKAFRNAVFMKATQKQEVNPCPGQKMVMYVAGPSAAGKSFLQGHFVEQVKNERNHEGTKSATPTYTVSVDGGIDREMCQMRQMVLQAALSKGYAGIEDLHEHTDTSVKSQVQKAAMKAGDNFHVVIPATFISGLLNLTKMMLKLGRDDNIYQVFAEVTAADDSDSALESFRKTVLYNGESRAYLDDKEGYKGGVKMNNRDLPCESKKYPRKYFDPGVSFSKQGKNLFKRFANSERSLILSNKSDNMHVNENGEQVTSNPTVKHVTQRAVNLWKALNSGEGIDEAYQKCFGKEPDNELIEEFKGKSLKDFISLLKEKGLNIPPVITSESMPPKNSKPAS